MNRLSRQTKQKEILIREITKFNYFFTAGDLHSKVRKIDDKIGIATVYRLLKDLRNKNQLHSYLCNKKLIYSIDSKSHCHFTCQKCGKVKHIKMDSIDFIKRNLRINICHFQIDMCGMCENCSER